MVQLPAQPSIDTEPLHLEQHTTTLRYRHSHTTDRRLRNLTTYPARNTVRISKPKPRTRSPKQ